ncbi:sulfite exporter TauE/SafE family protein [Psychromonas sp. MB-3u-54]|uniref:sulfite exporter TauE/SafE family protein n=1 Tax=Psychromonas sp. MB-3u-54 TaxID=2058319 RepID=UPI001E3F76FB|nr:sulfite exporter TauE/SafE family protein [Psychromonas sp. MB-3u-54]
MHQLSELSLQARPVTFKPEQHFKGTTTEGTARYTEKDQPVGCAQRTDLRSIECTLPIPLINFRSQFNFFWYYLVLARYQDINLMNGIKLLISSIVSLIAIVIFIANGTIYWSSGFFVLLGTLSGGYFAAKLSRTLSQAHIRMFVTVASLFITVYFFYDTYAAAMIDNT